MSQRDETRGAPATRFGEAGGMLPPARTFALPDLGEGVKEGRVLRILAAEGERVEEDQLIVEVETDKAAVEIPSPFAGVIERWHVREKDLINVGDPVVTFAAVSAPPAPRAAAEAPRPAASPPGPAAAPTIASPRRPASPAVRKLARERGVDLASIDGSGPGGRVLIADVERGARRAAAPPAAAPAPPPSHAPAAPSCATSAAIELPAGRDDRDAYGSVRRAAIAPMRRAIAARMIESVATIPHVTDCDDADITELDRLRRGYNASAPEDQQLGVLPFLVRAVVRALQAFPLFNASYDHAAGEIVYRRYCNVAIGVHTERGLAAPVLRDADRMTILEIGAAITRLTAHAHAGTLALDEARGATYTISNAGAMGGSRYSTPIITPPQVAVLAAGRARLQPWVVDGAVVPRLVLPLSHSMDHRVIDGGAEIAFMRHVIGDLEAPGRLMLG